MANLNRVVMIGDAAVGKTSLLNRALGRAFHPDEVATLGANWYLYTHECSGSVVELQLWDTAGEEKYRSLGPLYYRTAVAAVVVYDITRRQSFESVAGWIAAFVGIAGTGTAIVVVGNKADLDGAREVTEREALEWCEARGYDWYEASAQTGQNVRPAFEMLAESVARLRLSQVPRLETDIGQRSKQAEKCC